MATAFPVGGTVKFADGSLLVGGQVSFSPVKMEVGSKIRYEGVGLVNEKGQYKIGVNGDASGVPAGEYKVTIEPREYKELPKSNSAKIPAAYRENGSTPLTLTVKEGDNSFDIVLK